MITRFLFHAYLHLHIFLVPSTHQVIEMQELPLIALDGEAMLTCVSRCQRKLASKERQQ